MTALLALLISLQGTGSRRGVIKRQPKHNKAAAQQGEGEGKVLLQPVVGEGSIGRDEGEEEGREFLGMAAGPEQNCRECLQITCCHTESDSREVSSEKH